jgi:hypothetical protein
MGARIEWTPLTLGVAFALASAHCTTTPPPPCQEASDCEAFNWTNIVCSEDEGYWDCIANRCVSLCLGDECTGARDCIDEWTADCEGHFGCVNGQCEQVCENDTCGDGLCDTSEGETKESCPGDCEIACEIAGNCVVGHEWDAPCDGRWACESQSCVAVCDYASCGDGACSPGEGENEDSCPGDCLEGCRVPSDCFSEQWAPEAICQGRWNCLQGECDRVCDHVNCGDGVCLGLNGENEESCFRDCLGGPCEALIDCMGQRWYDPDRVPCQGHWECIPPMPPGQLATGACEAVCADGPEESCGDGTCDTANGETPTSCRIDCSSGYSCERSEDCDVLTLPDGCSGDWICASRLCVPQCE